MGLPTNRRQLGRGELCHQSNLSDRDWISDITSQSANAALAASHRWEERHFGSTLDWSIELDMGPVDSGPEGPPVGEGRRTARVAGRKIVDEIANGLDRSRNLDHVLAPSDDLSNPGEIENLHDQSTTWRRPARK